MISMLIAYCLLPLSLAAQPDWVVQKGSSARFPSADYLTGLGIATWHRDSSVESVTRQSYAAAQQDLAEKVQVHIQATSESFKQQVDQSFLASYQTVVTASSQLEVVGLQKEIYHDQKQRLFYTWVYARKPAVVAHYQQKLATANRQLPEWLAQAQRYAREGHRAEAEQQLLACRTLLTQYARWQAVVRSLQPTASPTEPAVGPEQIADALHQLIHERAATLSDLAYTVAYQLRLSLDTPLQRVVVAPLVYHQSEMASAFSYFFRNQLEQELIRHADWQTVRPEDVRFNQGSPNMQYSLRGTYTVTGDQLHVSVFLKDVFAEQVIGVATAQLNVAVVEAAQLAYLPPRYEQNQAEQQLLAANEVPSTGIDLEVWTNKGKEALVFTEGERMNVFFRANMPCHVRFIYHLADGQRVHFFDQYLTAEQVDRAHEVPYDFICDCTDAPCGVETLQINAQEAPFAPLATQDIGGYRFITEDLTDVLQKTRGLQRDEVHYQAERRLVITTMKKPQELIDGRVE